MYQTIAHMREAISEKNFRAVVTDVTHELGVLSIQGKWSDVNAIDDSWWKVFSSI